ncbi:PP2C family protein-serine/threonine phosphatase [Paraburkholderia aromaticivorans]|uniref:PP2C family protein-serine/threonine phosphatase n=1 Tax=Paraburkholderia aromaticivorans TaxID=2026199 RepID=UPI00197F3CAF|nr:protein phosphatase 2C domain-containing protein [Paraburkholderia aromaticivorans]
MGQRSETGYVRTENQDRMSWVRTAQADIFAVLDGMGGHAGGAIAAQLAARVLQRHFEALASPDTADAVLRSALRDANETIYVQAQSGDPATLRMGTTAVVLVAADSRIMLAHVGDSRAYLMKRNGELRALTKDHSQVQKMVDAGLLTQAQAASHPDANVLERALGHAAQVEVEVSKWLRLRSGDSCMLCSDGLHGYVSDVDIAAVLQSARSPQEQADELVKLALERGGEDNVTVQVIRYGERRGLRSGRGFGAFVRKAGIVIVPLLCVAVLVLGWFTWLVSPSKVTENNAQTADLRALASSLRGELAEAKAQHQATEQELVALRKHVADLEAKLPAPPAARAASAAGAVSAVGPSAIRKPPLAKAKSDNRKPPEQHRGTAGAQTAAGGRAASKETKADTKASANAATSAAASSSTPVPDAPDTPASPNAAPVH